MKKTTSENTTTHRKVEKENSFQLARDFAFPVPLSPGGIQELQHHQTWDTGFTYMGK